MTFVPASAVDAVSEKLFAAGAGRIGNYQSCSFRTPGTGTFFGGEGSNPAVGQAGRLERVEEVRLETIASIKNVDRVVGALCEAHPYEEPAFDLVSLAAPPTTDGIGRVAELDHPIERAELLERIKSGLELSHLLVRRSNDGIRQARGSAPGHATICSMRQSRKKSIYTSPAKCAITMRSKPRRRASPSFARCIRIANARRSSACSNV